jgi:3-(3-hydroxy-phenyl)propionate hydroxylase
MTKDTDVLVIGLGPVGAMLSALLAQRGVRVIAIDRDKDVYPLPRAAHFDHEIMRLFQQLGIADDVLAHARPAPAYEFHTAKGEALLRFELSARPSLSGWPQSFMFHQPGMENALRARIAGSANAEMRLGCKLVSFAENAEGIAAKLARDGREETVRARFLVGCDGASSAVREALGIELASYDFDEPWLVIDTIPGPDTKVPDINLQICDPERPTTCVLMGPGRHRWEFMLKPGETAEQVLDEPFIRGLLAAWDCSEIAIDRKAVYRFHGLVAEQWRKGRAVLAGDSAHQMPPFAGQGMCAGLRDAANLAWKLAAVLNGADATLLDTYQQEREPHVRATIELAIHMGRVVCTTDPAAALHGRVRSRVERRRYALPPALERNEEAGRSVGRRFLADRARGRSQRPRDPGRKTAHPRVVRSGAGTVRSRPWRLSQGPGQRRRARQAGSLRLRQRESRGTFARLRGKGFGPKLNAPGTFS